MNCKPLFLIIIFALVSINFVAQDDKKIIKDYLVFNEEKLNVAKQDVESFVITDSYYSKSTKLTHVYIKQIHHGIELFNGKASFNILDAEVYSCRNSLVSGVASKVNGTSPSLSATDALKSAADKLELEFSGVFKSLEIYKTNSFLFDVEDISQESIPVELVYFLTEDNELRLAWDMSLYTLDSEHWWSVRIDAVNGEILDKNDWVRHCEFDKNTCEESSHNHLDEVSSKVEYIQTPMIGQYNVYAIPTESPSHGPRSIVVNPEDVNASPYGWHDTNGSPGHEYTITRGNNVYAYEDVSSNNSPGFIPDGTDALSFNFPLNLSNTPTDYLAPAITNLFYMNNIMHDVWYNYGFDEPSGNFQKNNYSNGGNSNDYVNAEAQDGSGTNNANFATPPDGSRPRMQMFLWGEISGNAFVVNSPPSANDLDVAYNNSTASFGPIIPSIPITANLVLVDDGQGGDPYDACESIDNGAAINGKIAVIRRGECLFVEKIEDAQDEGALAVIIINNVPGDPVTMGGDSNTITIPSIMISMSQGQPILDALIDGDLVNGTIVSAPDGDLVNDSDFDNGIIAHEYGHGISNRLTGGASDADCLYNAEQMGEGWSDWFGLMLTIEPGDQAADIRGIGTYVTDQSITGSGLRPAPYSTNMGINGYTYGDTNNDNAISEPHGIGFVWSTMLWDLTWAFIDVYGYDSDIYNGTGGNNMVMQLVIDGLKLQPCEPGFVDGRDAILEADMLLYNGAHQCMIWEVFANRGLGNSASQGSSWSRYDQEEAFDVPFTTNAITHDFNLCEGESITYNGEIYSSAGTFVANYSVVGGCDSVVTINIALIENVLIELENITLSVSNGISNATYQWINCDGNVEIDGATNFTFTPEESGNYAVMMTTGSCEMISDCMLVSSVDINELSLERFDVYPNPTNENLTIEFNTSKKVSQVFISDVRGKVIYINENIDSNKLIIDISNYSKGIYSLRIVQGDTVIVRQVVKE